MFKFSWILVIRVLGVLVGILLLAHAMVFGPDAADEAEESIAESIYSWCVYAAADLEPPPPVPAVPVGALKLVLGIVLVLPWMFLRAWQFRAALVSTVLLSTGALIAACLPSMVWLAKLGPEGVGYLLVVCGVFASSAAQVLVLLHPEFVSGVPVSRSDIGDLQPHSNANSPTN